MFLAVDKPVKYASYPRINGRGNRTNLRINGRICSFNYALTVASIARMPYCRKGIRGSPVVNPLVLIPVVGPVVRWITGDTATLSGRSL